MQEAGTVAHFDVNRGYGKAFVVEAEETTYMVLKAGNEVELSSELMKVDFPPLGRPLKKQLDPTLQRPIRVRMGETPRIGERTKIPYAHHIPLSFFLSDATQSGLEATPSLARSSAYLPSCRRQWDCNNKSRFWCIAV